jgi:hypothetical protein
VQFIRVRLIAKIRFRFSIESLPNVTKREKFREESLGTGSRFFLIVQRKTQALVSPDSDSSFKNPAS